MLKQFGATTIHSMLAGTLAPSGEYVERVPLHVEFDPRSNCVESDQVTGKLVGPEIFNAVGSLAVTNDRNVEGHLPVIDVDGGVTIQKTPRTKKAILASGYQGTYEPTSMLRDVLGDNGIDLEVFDKEQIKSGISGYYLSDSPRVKAIVLRSQQDIFESVESTTEGHNHLYIQSLFSESDHATLIDELCMTGIISQSWKKLVDQEGMGVVRAPWTTKDLSHMPS